MPLAMLNIYVKFIAPVSAYYLFTISANFFSFLLTRLSIRFERGCGVTGSGRESVR